MTKKSLRRRVASGLIARNYSSERRTWKYYSRLKVVHINRESGVDYVTFASNSMRMSACV